jgi:S1-C subfamily serine protease
MLLTGSPQTGAADAKLRETARGVLRKYQDAVVTVRLTSTDEDGQNEMTAELSGTVINSEGVTVCSLSSPRALVPPSPKIKEAKIILSTGREIVASVVGKDEEHDLVFLTPAERLRGLAYLTLAKKADVGLLDEVVVLYRMSEKLKRRVAVNVCRVSAEGDKKGNPAVLDLVELGLGGPVFDSDGRPIGVVTAASFSASFSAESLALEPVIRSAEFIEAALKKFREK